MRVIVVGAGLVGASVALSLRRAGADVVVIERGIPGAEASHAAGGILSPQAECDVDGPLLQLCLRGLAATRRLCRSLVEDDADQGRVLGLREAGTLDVAFDAATLKTLEARVAWQHALGLQAEMLDGDGCRAQAPGLSRAVIGGAWFKDEASLDPRLLYDELRRAGDRAGVAVVRALVDEVTATTVVVRDGGARTLDADAVVVCAGAWTPQVRGVAVTEDVIFPVRGQIVCVQQQVSPAKAFSCVVYGAAGYVVPRSDGRVLCGSTMERVGFAKATTPAGLARIGTMLASLMPDLAETPVVDSWSGLRPATTDGLPLLGQEASGVWLASGHFRNGVLLAAISGDLLASALLRGEPIPAAFSPQRTSADVRSGVL